MTFFNPIDDQQAHRVLLLVAILCGLVVLASIPLPRDDGQLIGSDGKFYYAILRSFVFDRDFDYANDYDLLQVDTIDSIGITATGKRTNPFAVGVALLWLPFFLVAHLIAILISSIGIPIALDGSGNFYQAFVCIGTVLYASWGFRMSYELARRWFSPTGVFPAVLGLWLASPALYYMVGQPSMSHALSIWTNALFLCLWLGERHKDDTLRHSVLMGVAAGLLTLVRWQDGIFILFPVAEKFYRALVGDRTWGWMVLNNVVMGLTAALVFVPQLLMWHAVYGTALTMPQGGGFMHWFSPHPLQTLFSTRHGLVIWHPIFAFALLGIPLFWRRDRRLAFWVLFAFLLQLYINSAVERWWADEAFGGRRFTGLIPALILTLSAFIDRLLLFG
ncbi:hypothetical protein JW992_06835, partial [candidate division KSB1 bacterium]|nr:hypothetical protein [candidate division KSB1 bacterium]